MYAPRRPGLVAFACIIGIITALDPTHAAGQTGDPLVDAIRAAIGAMPMFERSQEWRDNAMPEGIDWSYRGEGDAGMLALPISEPTTATFTIAWSIQPRSLRPDPAERQRAFEEGMKRSPCKTKNVNPGTLGLDTCVGSEAQRGTLDPNWSADPYMSSGTAWAVRLCADVWVQANLAAYPHASHGARDKGNVIQTMENVARNLVMAAATELMRAVDAGCTQIAQQSGATPADPNRLHVEVLCPTTTIEISRLPSLNCHIIFRSWIRNTDDPVRVTFPNAIDGFGNHANGIQIAQGAGQEFIHNWDGPPHYWGMFVFACPSQDNTGANCYNSVTTPGPVTVPIIVQQRDQTMQLTLSLTAVASSNFSRQVSLNAVFGVGYFTASAELGAQSGWNRTFVDQALAAARDYAAASTVIPADDVTRIIASAAGASDAQLHQWIVTFKTNSAVYTNRACQNNLNLWYIWVLGYHLSNAELGAQTNAAWTREQLVHARNAAAAVGLPVAGIDQLLGWLGQGYQPSQLHQQVVDVKNQIAGGTNFVYMCN